MANRLQIMRGLKSKISNKILSLAEPYFCTDTRELYMGTGSGNVNMGGSMWYKGTAMSGTVTTTGYYSYSACPQVKVGDTYLNTSNGNVYECTTAGSGTTAKWTYKGSIRGATGEKGCNASTLVVAAADSKNKDSADYICTGTNDQDTINNAINALPSGGGKIVLLEGTYNLSDAINITKSNITLSGQGSSTFLSFSDTVTFGVYVKNADYVVLSDFAVSGCASENVRVQNSKKSRVENVRSEGAGEQGISLDAYSENCIVVKNTCINNGVHGIRFYNNINDGICALNICTGNDKGISIEWSSNVLVTNNVLKGNTTGIQQIGGTATVANNIVDEGGET